MRIKPVYINGMAALSPQPTFGQPAFPTDWKRPVGARLICEEPDYSRFFPANQIRRMSRLLKMGLTAAMQCLENAGLERPGAIITGTGKGSMIDNERFIHGIYEDRERMLNPTAFIQSTYNAVNGLIALQTQCIRYNNTYVHRGFSFEHALLDAVIQIGEGEGVQVLTGGFDEMTDEHYFVMSRAGFWKESVDDQTPLLLFETAGTISGEGATFFVLEERHNSHSYARLSGMGMLYKPTQAELQAAIAEMLAEAGIDRDDIDLLITGRNGNCLENEIYDSFKTFLPGKPEACFKHLCGEYMTATAFGMWLACMTIKEQFIPDIFRYPGAPTPARYQRVLLLNYQNKEQCSYFLFENTDI